MTSNREIRQNAWKIVRSQWLWRLISVAVVLNAIAQTVSLWLRKTFQDVGIQTWNDFMLSKARAWQSGLDASVPSSRLAWQMTGASACEYFIAYIFAAIFAYGFAVVALKSTNNQSERWFADSFGGFKRPLELAWLMFSMNMRVALWSLLFLFPGLIAAYRYRQAWYLKSEHPEWGAGECLKASAEMMRGFKWQAFCFDLSYCGWMLVVMLLFVVGLGVSSAVSGAGSVLSKLFGGLSLMALMFVLCYFFVGRAVFYREMSKSSPPSVV